jgi:hypothetical protein
MRVMGDAIVAQLRKDVRPFILSAIQFADQWFRVWSGVGSLVSGGNTYVGVGMLGKVSTISETTDVQANGISLSLSGVPSSIAAEALGQCRQGMPVTLSLGLMDTNWSVIDTPVPLFRGRMDTAAINEGADTCEIVVTAESRMIDLRRARVRRYTDDDQQRTSPGDRGFEFVPMVQDWNGNWNHNRS